MTTVIWIDWYSYHVSRFRALWENESFNREVSGIELVGGCGVHKGLRFREDDRQDLPISSLFPQSDWNQTGQLKLAAAVWRQLNKLSPSSVLVPGWYTAPALAAALWAKVHGKRSILMSETTEYDHRRVWWKELCKRTLVSLLFDSGVVGGKPHARYLTQLGLPPDRIARFYDVVDNRFYQQGADQARQTPGLKQSCELPSQYFLYVGRLAAEKNVGLALKSYAQYRKAGGDWSFVLVGDGPERRSLEKQSIDLGVSEHVMFAGLKTARELTSYYAFASCFVLPSLREPWGLVVNEAMASGLPLVVSNRCGCAEDLVEHGANGYLVDPTDELQLAGLMSKVTRLPQPALESMGRRSREIIADYSPERWALEVARII